jgi:carbamoyl-phosphate synthase large subunit
MNTSSSAGRQPPAEKPRKVLVIGSGPIVIGQAAEFDYAGTQACRALREEGVETVLVNSNPATIMTDDNVADVVYVEPLTPEVLERVIARERPDGLLPTLGGQTGLNLAVELADLGILDRYGVRLLGTPLATIKQAEDRELFKQLLEEIGEPVPDSAVVNTLEEARAVADDLGFPLIVRPAFTLGGTGGGIASDGTELERVVSGGLAASPIHQVLVERSLIGWKELEYEVMRDAADTCITVCNMENIDPMGVHTGDSIVVAPSQTLSDRDYQMLRSAALKIIRALGIQGGCNVQFALDPASAQYYVIEVNPRVSRSSALASKATGYPIARVAAKIAVGKRLDEIPNAVTRQTTAAFEPALDYLVVKIPRWPFDKFAGGDRTLGTQMKATGEVMAIDRSFEAALQKAVRSLEFGSRTLLWEDHEWAPDAVTPALLARLEEPTDLRIWALMAALRRDMSVDEVATRSRIDSFFIAKLANLVATERALLGSKLTPDLLRRAKRQGFSDAQLGTLADLLPDQVRALREGWGIRPVYKMVDTCAAEFEAVTPYFYSTYETENEAPPDPRPKAIVIGSGPIRIGQGIEFDYCSVHAAEALRESGVDSIMVNSNPETVSTDFDASSRLYFEPLDAECVRDVVANETGADEPPSLIVQFGGQTAINLAEPLARVGTPILGSSVDTIDLAEDRHRFEDLMNRLGVPQPPGAAVGTAREALETAQNIGYPVLIRPSYVLGGRGMEIIHDASDLLRYVAAAVELSTRHPFLIDKYLEGMEIEVDALCDGEQVLIPGIMEHVERAGVHSGDSMAVYPAQELTYSQRATLVDYTTRLGLGLGVRGLFNVQYVLHRASGQIYVLEVNPRASRTVPFLSKVTGVPMVTLATRIMLERSLAAQGYGAPDGEAGWLWPAQPLVAVKAPVFSMNKLPRVDTYLGPEMKSTGEVMGVDWSYDGAMTKALIAAGLMLPPRGTILATVADRDKPAAGALLTTLVAQGYEVIATEGTAETMRAFGLPVARVANKIGGHHPTCSDVIRDGAVQAVLNTLAAARGPLRDGLELRRAAVERRIPCFTSLDTARVATRALAARAGAVDGYHFDVRPLREYLRGPAQPVLSAEC